MHLISIESDHRSGLHVCLAESETSTLVKYIVDSIAVSVFVVILADFDKH